MSITIKQLRPGDVAAASAALARAFHDDPGFRHVWPDAARRARALPPFLRIALADATRYAHTWAAYDGDSVVGVAAWLPPGAHPMSVGRQLRAMPGFARVIAAAPCSFPALTRLGRTLESAFPAEPTWYLVVVGVDPDCARRGVGTQLLEPELEAADRVGRRCYLETVSEVNVRWYERLGFRVERSGWDVLDGGPTYWSMVRP